MKLVSKKILATRIAQHFLGKPYIWGGDDPVQGFDCSGFVIEILKSVGILPRSGDWTAAGLWDRFKGRVANRPSVGCLVFYRGSINGPIIHVEYCLDGIHSIGASGGGSRIKNSEDAISQNAYIKIRPIESRAGIAGFVDPFGLLEYDP